MDDGRIQSQISQLVAYDSIRQLVARYAWCLDTRDLDTLVGLFVEDVRVSKTSSGRTALRESFASQLRNIGPTTLFVGNHIIDLDANQPNAATGVVYCRAYIQEPHGFVEQMIVYSDRYRHEAGSWRFVGRRHELFYGIVTSEQPHAQELANWPQRSTGVGTMPFRLDSWQRFATTGE